MKKDLQQVVEVTRLILISSYFGNEQEKIAQNLSQEYLDSSWLFCKNPSHIYNIWIQFSHKKIIFVFNQNNTNQVINKKDVQDLALNSVLFHTSWSLKKIFYTMLFSILLLFSKTIKSPRTKHLRGGTFCLGELWQRPLIKIPLDTTKRLVSASPRL